MFSSAVGVIHSNSTARILDVWFFIATIGFVFFVVGVLGEVSGLTSNIVSSKMLVFSFIAFISFTAFLASKSPFATKSPAKWLLVQFFFSVGAFVWYYLAVYRHKIVTGGANA